MLPRITDREELIALVQRILDMRYAEGVMPDILDLLVRSTGCPEVSDLIYWPKLMVVLFSATHILRVLSVPLHLCQMIPSP